MHEWYYLTASRSKHNRKNYRISCVAGNRMFPGRTLPFRRGAPAEVLPTLPDIVWDKVEDSMPQNGTDSLIRRERVTSRPRGVGKRERTGGTSLCQRQRSRAERVVRHDPGKHQRHREPVF